MAIILYLLILLFISANAIYLLVFSIAGLFTKRIQPKNPFINNTVSHGELPNVMVSVPNQTYLVLYPVYKEDAVVLASVKNFIQQDYTGKYTVCVLADALKDETIALINTLPHAMALPIPADEHRNKAKSINYALGKIDTNYTYCIVMDADNTVDTDFLSRIDAQITPQQKIVQLQRVAKNNNTTLAFSDGLSEKINNHIFRAGHYNMGLSASLIGSGMVIDMPLFIHLMHSINAFSGFDKELELKSLEEKVRMHYMPSVVVYDEKVSHGQAFVNQKRRWLFAQYNYLFKYFPKAVRLLLTQGNVDYFDKIIQFVFFPRLILLGLAFITTVLSVLLHVHARLAILNVVLILAALIIPIRTEVFSFQFVKAVVQLPLSFVRMIYALLTSKQAAKKFIHTPHNVQ